MSDVIDALKAAHRNAIPPTPFDLDDSIRRGQRRLRRRRITNVGLGVAAAAGVVAAALLLPESTNGPDPVDEATFAILDEPQREVDELPPTVRQEMSRIDLSSTRLIGEYDDLSYWLATSEEGDTCVVAAENETWLSTSCGRGPWLGIGNRTTDDEIVTALAFADNLHLGITQHAGFTVISDNLAISTMSENERAELTEVLESSSEYFTVFAEPQRPSDRLPEAQNRSDWPFQEAATRYVGEYRDVRYWMGALQNDPPEDHEQICLIGVAAGGEWRGTSCSDPLNVSGEAPRWPLEHTDPEELITVALVPDDYELTDEQSSTLEQVAPNLYRDATPTD